MPPLNICLLAVCIVLLVVIIIMVARIGNCQRDSFTAKEMNDQLRAAGIQARAKMEARQAQMRANSAEGKIKNAANEVHNQAKNVIDFAKRPAFPWKFGDGMNDKGMFKRCEAKYGAGKCEKIGAIVYPKK